MSWWSCAARRNGTGEASTVWWPRPGTSRSADAARWSSWGWCSASSTRLDRRRGDADRLQRLEPLGARAGREGAADQRARSRRGAPGGARGSRSGGRSRASAQPGNGREELGQARLEVQARLHEERDAVAAVDHERRRAARGCARGPRPAASRGAPRPCSHPGACPRRCGRRATSAARIPCAAVAPATRSAIGIGTGSPNLVGGHRSARAHHRRPGRRRRWRGAGSTGRRDRTR